MYKYPDKNDFFTSNIIKPIDHWDKGEDQVLKQFYSMIQSNNSLLDAGCGKGRLINKYERYFNEITIVERDPERLGKANNLINHLNLESKVNIKLDKIQNLREEKKFDSIICSHVLQHVSTYDCEDILEKFAKILYPKGLLLIFIPHSLTAKEVFTKIERYGNGIKETEITVDDFNYLTEKSSSLPVRKFTSLSIYSLVIKHGFKRVKSGLYRIVNDNPDSHSRTPRKIITMDFFLIAEKL